MWQWLKIGAFWDVTVCSLDCDQCPSPPSSHICTIFAQSSYSCTLKMVAGGSSKTLLTAYQMVTHPRRPSLYRIGVLTAVVVKNSIFALIYCFVFE
jgi:hypothetical protein